MRFIILMMAMLAQLNSPALAMEVPKEKLDKIFQGYDASFMLESIRTGKKFYYNKNRTTKRFPPCSTYKIFNSLVGLETGVLKNEFEAKKWDGTNYSIKSWNRDQTLQSAMTNSCLWYYQIVAKDVGRKRMQEYLDKANYGNRLIKGDLTRFWLGDSLLISQEEQVAILKKLVNDELPFSKRTMAIVRGLIKNQETKNGVLYGKTGSDMKDGSLILGWYVGYVSTTRDVYVFATNIEKGPKAWGPQARTFTKSILNEMKLL